LCLATGCRCDISMAEQVSNRSQPTMPPRNSQPTLPPTGEGIAWSMFLDALVHPTADKWEHAVVILGMVAILRFISVAFDYMKELCCSVLKERRRAAALDADEEVALILQEVVVVEELRILRPLWKELSSADKGMVKKDRGYWLIRRWGYTVRSAMAWICIRLLVAHMLPINIAFYVLWAVPSDNGWDTVARIAVGFHYVVYSFGLAGGILMNVFRWWRTGHQREMMPIIFLLLLPSPVGFQVMMKDKFEIEQPWDAAAAFEKAPLWHVLKLFSVLLVLPERISTAFAAMIFCGWTGKKCNWCCGLSVAFLEPVISYVLWSWRMYMAPDFWPCVALLHAAYGMVGAVGFFGIGFKS